MRLPFFYAHTKSYNIHVTHFARQYWISLNIMELSLVIKFILFYFFGYYYSLHVFYYFVSDQSYLLCPIDDLLSSPNQQFLIESIFSTRENVTFILFHY